MSVVRDLVHGQVAYERIIPFTRHKSWLACVGGSKNVSNSSATKVSSSRCATLIVVKRKSSKFVIILDEMSRKIRVNHINY